MLAFDRIEQQVGHARFVAMLGANGYTRLEEVPSREAFVALYTSLQAEIELTGVTPPPVAADPPVAPRAEPSAASAQSNGTHAKEPSTGSTETMPAELADIWKRIQSIPTVCSIFCDLKKELIDVAGMDRAEELYQTTLGLHGVAHSNQFRNLGTARQCASRLWQQIQTLKHPLVPNPDISDEDVPFGNDQGWAA